MQQCQDRLEFRIETPSDEELARRFADQQRGLDGTIKQAPRAKAGHKTRNRKSKQQKKQERMNREKV